MVSSTSENNSYLSKPNPKASKEPGIRFLTFNTWGLKYVSKFRKERLREITNRLASDEKHQYDVVALQEIWCEEDWDYMNETLQGLYPYRRWFKSGIITGPGLAILSKIPIESTFLYRFPINGRPSAFFRGDWYVGKSISVTILRASSLNSVPIAVLNSHMHAPYAATGDAAYDCHRACQAWDFAKIAKLMSMAGYAVIVVGDLNSKPDSLPFRILTKNSNLDDSWNVLMKSTNAVPLTVQEISRLEPNLQLVRGATTCDSSLNTWRAHLPVSKACRLDYALISPKLEPLEALVRFTEQVPNVGSLSDHFAYYCRLRVSSGAQGAETVSTLQNDLNFSVDDQKNILYERLQVALELKALISDYQKHTILRWQLRWRAAHVLVSIFLIIGLHVMVPFTSGFSSWSSVLVMLLATILAITATGNGLIVILFLPKEYRALQEVKLQASDQELSVQEQLAELLSTH